MGAAVVNSKAGDMAHQALLVGDTKHQTLLSALTQAAWGSVSGSYQRVCPGGTSQHSWQWLCHRVLQQLLRVAASKGFLTHQGRGPECAWGRPLL